MVDGQTINGGKATLSNHSILLEGGHPLPSQYVELGAGILGDGNEVTIEIWATPLKVLEWSRIFGIAADKGVVNDHTDSLFMTWNRLGDISQDRVEAGLANKKKVVFNDDSNAPYQLGREYHIVMTIENFAEGRTRFTWYTAPANSTDLGPAKGSFICEFDLEAFTDNFANLGWSTWGDSIANAEYNEVRVYHSVLNSKQLEASHKAGPNDITVDIPEFSTFGLISALSVFSWALTRRRKKAN